MKVCSLVFVSWCLLILGPTWLLFMMDWVLSCASGQDRSELVLSHPAEGSCSFHLLQQTLFLLSFLCFFLSNASVQFPLSFPLIMFSHSLGLFVTSHFAFSISIFNTQHTLLSRVTYKIHAKVQDGQKKFAVANFLNEQSQGDFLFTKQEAI